MITNIQSIYKGFTNTMRMPYTIAKFACGHGVSMTYRDKMGDLHAPDNWLLQVGDEANCARCDENSDIVQHIIAFTKTPDYSHITLRDMTANKTGEWMSFCVYRIDRTSPTQCCLEMSVKANPVTEKALRDAGINFIPGPSRGRMAME